jgi:hypothetical protein
MKKQPEEEFVSGLTGGFPYPGEVRRSMLFTIH